MLQYDKILKQKKVNVTIIPIYNIINQDEKKKKMVLNAKILPYTVESK